MADQTYNLSQKAAQRTADAVRKILDGNDLTGDRNRRRSYSEAGFDALITCYVPLDYGKWRYGFVEVYRSVDTWVLVPGGRAGNPCCVPGDEDTDIACGAYALNSCEAFNSASEGFGIQGDSTDLSLSKHGETRYLIPVRGYCVVRMNQLVEQDDSGNFYVRYSFAYENDRLDTDYAPAPPQNTCCPTIYPSSSSSSNPCCPCFTITYTEDDTVPPLELKQSGATWTSTDGGAIMQLVGGVWQLDFYGTVYTAGATPCPPTSFGDFTVTTHGSWAVESYDCGCSSSSSCMPCPTYTINTNGGTPITLTGSDGSYSDDAGDTLTLADGTWTLTLADASQFTSDLPCPPTDASAWMAGADNGSNLVGVKCNSSSSSSSCSPITNIRWNDGSGILECSRDCGDTWETILTAIDCNGDY